MQINFTRKYLGLSEDGQNMRFSISFHNISKVILVPLEKGKEMLEKAQAEEERKEEAARFNQFRRK